MALTLTQLEYLATDEMKKGIMKTIIKESPILQRLPFVTVTGNSYLYNVESTEAGTQWATVGAIITESPPIYAQRTAALSNLIGDADVDQFMAQSRTNVQDITAAIIELKAKAIAYEFEKQFIYGGVTTTSPTYVFDGLLKLIAESDSTDLTTCTDLNPDDNTQVISQVLTASSAGATLSLIKIDETVDAVRPGKPDCLIMSRMARRDVNSLMHASGVGLAVSKDEFGRMNTMWGDTPILVNDFIKDNMQDPTAGIALPLATVYATNWSAGYDNYLIFACKFGESEFHGLQNRGIQVEPIGTLETKDAKRTRIKWYVGAAMPGLKSCAVLINANAD